MHPWVIAVVDACTEDGGSKKLSLVYRLSTFKGWNLSQRVNNVGAMVPDGRLLISLGDHIWTSNFHLSLYVVYSGDI